MPPERRPPGWARPASVTVGVWSRVRGWGAGSERGAVARGTEPAGRRRATRALSVVAALIVVTGSCAGSVTTPATQVADTTATVEGLVFDPVDATISYWFEYGRTTAYGSETPHRSLVISDRETHPVSEVLTDLLPGTTYHYQTCAQTHVKLCGGDRTLTTTGTPPLISTEPMLFPGFDPTVSDYVTRCGAVPLKVFVSAPEGTDVAVAGGPASTGEFTTDVPLTRRRERRLLDGHHGGDHVLPRPLPARRLPDLGLQPPGRPQRQLLHHHSAERAGPRRRPGRAVRRHLRRSRCTGLVAADDRGHGRQARRRTARSPGEPPPPGARPPPATRATSWMAASSTPGGRSGPRPTSTTSRSSRMETR